MHIQRGIFKHNFADFTLKFVTAYRFIMETEQIADELQKKGRVRRKQTLNTILKQMHFYFSDSNLSKDRFLANRLQESEYVDLDVFLTFNKISKLTSSVEEIAKALKKSDLLELNEDCTKVKRTTPHKIKTNEDECIIYVQTIQPDTTHEWLTNVFSEFGKVEYVSIPKYSHNKFAKGFAFIEYENVEQVKTALEYFESIGGRISSQINSEELCSNKTYEEGGDVKLEEENESEPNEKKRKHVDDEEGDVEGDKNKKIKAETQEEEDSKQKKRSTKRKALIKEHGLQVLTKLEWKKLRNRYWEMQRKKMKQLKQHLYKHRLHQNNYLDIQNQHVKTHSEVKVGKVKTENDGMHDYTPGIIVKLKLTEPWAEAKIIKNELKSLNNTIQYVEVPVTLASDEVYLRFVAPENANEFCASNPKGQGIVLTGEEEKQYWEKIKTSRDARLNKDVKKQRGRDKLLKRAERELGKHIRFDDTD